MVRLFKYLLVFFFRFIFKSFNWFGAFPVVYDQNKRIFLTSKVGLLVTLIYIAIVGIEIRSHLLMLIIGTIKKSSAVSAIVLCTNALGLLFLLLRRIVYLKDLIRCYNSLPEWPAEITVRMSSLIIFFASIVGVLIEFVGYSAER